MNRRKLFPLLTAACLALAAGPVFCATPEEFYREGARAQRNGKLEEAVVAYLAAERADPLYPYPTYALALIARDEYLKTRKGYQLAKERFARIDNQLSAATSRYRGSSLNVSYLDYANLLLAGNENAEALQLIDLFLLRLPSYVEMEKARNARGVALFRLNRFEEAAGEFRLAMASNPAYLAPRVNLRGLFLRVDAFEQARLEHRLGRPTEALARIDELLRIASGFTPALRFRADILKETGRVEEALESYRAVLAADQEDLITHGVRLDMAKIYEERGDLREALTLLNENATRFNRIENDPTRAEIIRIVEKVRGAR